MAAYSEIELSGLIGSNPLGALAAFGVLRLCQDVPELKTSKLYWRMEDDWMAVLGIEADIKNDTFVELLVNRQESRSLDTFNWSVDIRVNPQDYRNRLIDQAQKSAMGEHWHADYYAAYGSEYVMDGSKGLVKPTAFHMTSGQQKFLDSIVKLGKAMQNDTQEAFREALFGPWKYADQQHSLGWDPTTERMYALRHRAPTSENPRCVSAAVWLAVEALPLFPTVSKLSLRRNKTELVTTGFHKTRKNTTNAEKALSEVKPVTTRFQTVLTWPVWTYPIGIDSLRAVLATAELLNEREGWQSLGRRGISAIYQSVRSEFGQGYAILRPAILLWSAE